MEAPSLGDDMMYCPKCGNVISTDTKFCQFCKHDITPIQYIEVPMQEPVQEPERLESSESKNKWMATLILAIFLGSFGIHRFANKKIGTGILMLCTFGCIGIMTLYDIVMIATCNFTDKAGNRLSYK